MLVKVVFFSPLLLDLVNYIITIKVHVLDDVEFRRHASASLRGLVNIKKI